MELILRGTLIELRVESDKITITDVRSAFSNMNLGDLNVKSLEKRWLLNKIWKRI